MVSIETLNNITTISVFTHNIVKTILRVYCEHLHVSLKEKENLNFNYWLINIYRHNYFYVPKILYDIQALVTS